MAPCAYLKRIRTGRGIQPRIYGSWMIPTSGESRKKMKGGLKVYAKKTKRYSEEKNMIISKSICPNKLKLSQITTGNMYYLTDFFRFFEKLEFLYKNL